MSDRSELKTRQPKTASERSKQRLRYRIVIPIVVIAVIAISAILVPLFAGFDPLKADLGARLQPPGAHNSAGETMLFGTDHIGQDLLVQMLAGARISLLIGFSTLAIAGVVGMVIGLLAGYFGGILDAALMRIADIQLAFPAILLAILLASVMGQGVLNVIIVLSISNWVVFARIARSQVLLLGGREYVEAARTLGLSNFHILFRTLLPGCLPPLLVIATVELGHVIIAEASLSFLGVGVPMGVPSLGSTISNGVDYLSTAWWISTIPGILLLVLVLASGILGDAVRDRLDPRLRSM